MLIGGSLRISESKFPKAVLFLLTQKRFLFAKFLRYVMPLCTLCCDGVESPTPPPPPEWSRPTGGNMQLYECHYNTCTFAARCIAVFFMKRTEEHY